MTVEESTNFSMLRFDKVGLPAPTPPLPLSDTGLLSPQLHEDRSTQPTAPATTLSPLSSDDMESHSTTVSAARTCAPTQISATTQSNDDTNFMNLIPCKRRSAN